MGTARQMCAIYTCYKKLESATMVHYMYFVSLVIWSAYVSAMGAVKLKQVN
jgi:hypothetical protein